MTAFVDASEVRVAAIKAVAFDFDGTLIDSEYAKFELWHSLLVRRGVHLALKDWAEAWQESLLDPGSARLPERLQQLFGISNLEAIQLRVRNEIALRTLELPVFDPATSWIREAKSQGLRTAIVSNNQRSTIKGWLDANGLSGTVDVIIARGDFSTPKPASDCYVALARDLMLEPKQIVAIEDSLHGVRAALAAGITAFQVVNRITEVLPFEPSVRVIRDPRREFLNVFAR